MADHYRVNEPQVIHEELDGEVVAIDLASGNYYSMRGNAAVIWVAITGGLAASEAIELLVSEQPGSEGLAASSATYISQLEAANLLVPVSANGETDGEDARARATELAAAADSGVDPVLESFDDMQDLILLDPVHDIDIAQGWPHQPETRTQDE